MASYILYIPDLQRVGGDYGREDLVPVADDLPELGLARDAVARRELKHARPPDREIHLGEGGGGSVGVKRLQCRRRRPRIVHMDEFTSPDGLNGQIVSRFTSLLSLKLQPISPIT